MRLIGITGKAGSGKTTFSNILAQNENVGVIHVDDLLKEIKLKYFRMLMKKDKNGEKTKVNSKLKTILYKNKILFNMFMKFRAKLIQKRLNQEIDRLDRQGKNVILIDDIFLQYLKCYKDISLVFLLQRPYISRVSALAEREKLSKTEVVAYDIAHTSGSYRQKCKDKAVFTIDNNKGEEELATEANRIYTYNFAPVRKRYRVENYDISRVHESDQIKARNRGEEKWQIK